MKGLLSLLLAIGWMKQQPDNAAASAEAAEDAADAAADAVETVIGSTSDDVAYILGGTAAIEVAQPDAVSVSGSNVTIVGQKNKRYVCGEVTSINIMPVSSGITDVIFESGETPATLSVPAGVVWPTWFDATSLSASTTYEVSIQDGQYGAVQFWTVSA